jgi:hypothetical protein
MRLIDADKYKHGLNCAVSCTLHDERSQQVLKAMLMALDVQPTAYDPDKVVEQLEELRKECEDPLQDYDPNYFIDKAIEIVKGGEVNELLD